MSTLQVNAFFVAMFLYLPAAPLRSFVSRYLTECFVFKRNLPPLQRKAFLLPRNGHKAVLPIFSIYLHPP
jgi:hypothetical protein